MATWKAENLRLTGFTRAAWTEPVDEFWKQLVGTPADQISQRPREGTAVAEGSFEGARLVIAREPARTDLVWIVNLDAKPPNEYPTIGDFEVVLEPFLALATAWLGRNLSLHRMALGGVVVLPVANKDEGYKTLGRFLPQLKIDLSSADLLYQINRPRSSKVIAGLQLNRLCKWSVAQGVSLSLVITPGAETVAGPAGPSHSACRLEFDINSDGTRKDAFRSDQLVPLLNEFVSLAKEILERGDVP